MSMAQRADRVEEEIAVAIARARGGKGAGKMARELLARDSGPGLLVGLAAGAEQAVYYDSVTWSVTFVGFDESGVDGHVEAQAVERCRHRQYAERFVRDRADEFEWVHPRFRWVLDD